MSDHEPNGNALIERQPREKKILTNAAAVSLANVLRRSLPEVFREVFAPDFYPGLESEEDDIQGLGHMTATRVANNDLGEKFLSLSVKPSASPDILIDMSYQLQQAMFKLRKSEDHAPVVTFTAQKLDGTIIEPDPTTEETAEQIRQFAKRLKPFQKGSR